ncbi:MAG: mechanosensitive ion channel [Gammaproteobacteria bacterium]|jgi:small-conductance mechanosensitive channel|nr:mechanosensitive ion channel [Gammaproteobacteria bacterium]MBT5204578.1 mechanosensitive ion channel [Gammaproteobacteria bacterium]MBT5602891.1 mechanosensitive ion channel [Gammaproteobacteria bacterium]MBT6244722.1 mechanosensitive ion channel [Gammaproteobacteria bacterium]
MPELLDMTLLQPLVPMLVTLVASVLVLVSWNHFFIRRRRNSSDNSKFAYQLIQFLLAVVLLVSVIISSPLAEGTRNQVLALIGIVISGVVAFSSTVFVTNFMAALMLRVTKPFKVGDFIAVADYIGKVSQKGLFDTEIQSENRELVAIPNATFLSHPVVVSQSTGSMVFTTLSLGYDVSHNQVRPLMLQAAEQAGLTDPFVHITQLGDFAVTYKVSGLLNDVQLILTAKSLLNQNLLDVLHLSGIEIVSPSIARHIQQNENMRLIPGMLPVKRSENRVQAEEIVFDKAIEAKELMAARKLILRRLDEKKQDSSGDSEILATELKLIEDRLAALQT